jgi:hypothetical protein
VTVTGVGGVGVGVAAEVVVGGDHPREPVPVRMRRIGMTSPDRPPVSRRDLSSTRIRR